MNYEQTWHESLLEYQRPVPEGHQFFGPVFTKTRLLMLHSMLHFWENEGGSSVWVSNLYITEYNICTDFVGKFSSCYDASHTEDFQIYILERPWHLS